jgi:hypothetical protein
MATGRDFIWVLFLNDMRSAHIEDLRPVARADTQEALVAFVEREKATEPYQEPTGLPPTSPETEPGSAFAFRSNSQRWHKSFRVGGPLEWYNPPNMFDAGDHFQQVPRIIDRSQELDAIPPVS